MQWMCLLGLRLVIRHQTSALFLYHANLCYSFSKPPPRSPGWNVLMCVYRLRWVGRGIHFVGIHRVFKVLALFAGLWLP
jgi:hypothetical protein